MDTRKNLLEDLRKSSNCTLSQEQIGIRMGLPPDINGRHDYRVNRFETGQTKSWDVLNFFRYCVITNLDPRKVFVSRYPDEPYSQMFLEELGKEQEINMDALKFMTEVEELPTEEEVTKWIAEHAVDPAGELYEGCKEFLLSSGCRLLVLNRVNNPRTSRGIVPGKNACIIGTSGTGKTVYTIYPKIMAAMQADKNVFAILENTAYLEQIRKKAAETGHKVFVAEYPYDSIDWFSVVDEPESITMMVKSFATFVALRNNGDDLREEFIDVFERICRIYLWNDDIRNNVRTLTEYVLNMDTEELSRITEDKYHPDLLATIRQEILVALLYNIPTPKNNNPNTVSLGNAFLEEKHVIIYIADPFIKDMRPTLAVEQYLRMLNNVKEYGDPYKDTRRYEVIIDGLTNTYLDPETFKKVIADAHDHDLAFTYTIMSIEQLKDQYADDWKEMLDRTPLIMMTGLEKSTYSLGTEQYLSDRISGNSSTNGSTPEKGEGPKTALDPDEIRNSSCILQIE